KEGELKKLVFWVLFQPAIYNIYFIFSNKHLCEYLGYGEQKIIKLKKELVNFNLLTQERVG
ncbi:replication initiator protein A, partial [Staphylococcus aureus]